ncbi:MAG: MFS transporter [Sphingomonadales bacterium]|nr:MAG: MFS transporter [Sphingomonadales bacterium]TNF03288.1 MAG: MFS transporter [Sphingomonadales bacterium]
MMQAFDVQDFIDRQKLKPIHVAVLGMIGLVMFMDGFDIFMVGKIAPAIAQGFGVTPARMTEVFLLQQAGLAVGAFVVSPLSDYFGRKYMLVISAIIFGLLTSATVFATSITMLAVLRGLSGLFLAGVLPTAVALLAEFTPQQRRSTFIAVGMAGYSLGSTAGAGVALLVPAYGWQIGFWIGGLLPLLIAPILAFWLPESLSYRVNKNAKDPLISKTIARIEPGLVLTGEEEFILSRGRKQPGKTNLLDIFREGRARTTVLLFICCAFSMGNIALLAAWLPTFFQEMAGISIQRFAVVSMIAFLGGMVGTVSIGFMMDRIRPTRLIPAYYVGNAMALLLLSQIPFGTPAFVLLLAFWSFCQTGGQAGLNMLAAQIYPTSVRSTAVGWSGGVGRVGSIVTPIFGGFALASAFSLQLTLGIIAISPVIVALLVLLLRPPAQGEK